MMVRPWVVAAMGLGPVTVWMGPTVDEVARYRIEVKSVVEQDLTQLGQGKQNQAFANTGYFTVTTRDSAGGQSVTFTADSLVPGDESPIPADAAKSVAGTRWHGFRGANGRMGDLEMEGENPAAGILEPGVQSLLPPMARATPAGKAWTDTTDTDNNGIGVRTVTNFQTSDDSFNGTKVVRLAAVYSSAISGARTTPQGPVTIEGTGSGSNTWLVDGSGKCVSASHSADQQLTVSMSQVPQPIPVSVHTEGQVMLLP